MTTVHPAFLALASLLARHAGHPADLPQLMGEVVNVLHRHFPLAASYVYQPHAEQGWRLLAARRGDYTVRRSPRTMLVVHHMGAAQPQQTAPLTAPPLFGGEEPPPRYHPNTARRLLSLETEGQLVALLDLYTNRPLTLSEGDALDDLSVPLVALLTPAKTKENTGDGGLALQLQTASEVSQRITSILNIDQLLNEVVRLIQGNFNYYHTQIFFWDADSHGWRGRAAAGEELAEVALQTGELWVASDAGIVGRVGATGMTILAPNVTYAPDYAPLWCLPDSRAQLAVPLRVGSQVLGVLDVHSARVEGLTSHDSAIMETLGNQIAMALNSSQLFAAVEEQLSQREQLYQVASRIAAAQNEDDILRAIVEPLSESWLVRAGLIIPTRIHHELTEELVLAAIWNPTAQPSILPAGTRLSATLLPALQSLTAAQVQVVEVLEQDERIDPMTLTILRRFGTASLATIPLRVTGRVIGWLLLLSNRTHGFTLDVLRPFTTVADQAAVAVERAQLLTQTAERARRLTALNSLSATIVASLDVQATLEESVRAMAQLFGVKQSGVLLYERENRVARLVAQYREDGYRHEQDVLFTITEDGLAQEVIARRAPIYIRDIESDPLAESIRGSVHLRSYVAMLVVPLLTRNRVIGSISLDVVVGHERDFTSEEIELAQTMAMQLATAIDNARLYSEVTRRAHDAETAAQVGQQLTQSLQESEVLEAVVEVIGARFDFYHVAIYLRDHPIPNRASLRVGAGPLAKSIRERGHVIWAGQGLAGEALQTGIEQIANDVGDSDLFERHVLLPTTTAQAVYPLMIGPEILGVLDVHSNRLDPFDADMQMVLATIADQVAVALQNARLFAAQREAMQKLEEVDRLKNDFLASMSHELRTPLNSIIGFSKILLRGMGGPLTDAQAQDVGSIYRSGQHLLALINDVLDLSKIAANRMELHRQPIVVAEAMKDVLNLVQPQLADRKLHLENSADEPLPPIYGDPIRVHQILLNLLSNAIKFTDSGGVFVHARRVALPTPSEGKRQGIGDVQGAFIEISVRDTGIGIKAEDQEAIFEEFRQLSEARHKAGGTGLGLAIARRLAHLHGGWLWVESRYSHGSTFRFTLPIFEETAAEG